MSDEPLLTGTIDFAFTRCNETIADDSEDVMCLRPCDSNKEVEAALLAVIVTTFVLMSSVLTMACYKASRMSKREQFMEEPSVIIIQDDIVDNNIRFSEDVETGDRNHQDSAQSWKDLYDKLPTMPASERLPKAATKSGPRNSRPSTAFPSIKEDHELKEDDMRRGSQPAYVSSPPLTPMSARGSIGSLGFRHVKKVGRNSSAASAASNIGTMRKISSLKPQHCHGTMRRMSSQERINQLSRFLLNNEDVDLFRSRSNSSVRRSSSGSSSRGRTKSIDYLLNNFIPTSSRISSGGPNYTHDYQQQQSVEELAVHSDGPPEGNSPYHTIKRSVTALSLNSPIPVILGSPATRKTKNKNRKRADKRPLDNITDNNKDSLPFRKKKSSTSTITSDLDDLVDYCSSYTSTITSKSSITSTATLTASDATVTMEDEGPPPTSYRYIKNKKKQAAQKSYNNPPLPIQFLSSEAIRDYDPSAPIKGNETLTYRRQRRTGVHFSQDVDIYSPDSTYV